MNINSDNIVELINGGDYNPYHLLFYMLSNFRMIDFNTPIIYYYPSSSNTLVEQMLGMLPNHFIRHTEKESTLNYKPFLPTSTFKVQRPYFHDWTLPYDYDFIRSLFAPYYQTIRQKGIFIYISRSDAKCRRIINEPELLNELIPMGFIPIVMSDLSVHSQMNVFSQSDIIISPHGAGMAFMVFGSSETTVIELNKRSPNSRHYSHIAWHLEMDYYKILCEETSDKNDMIVDINRLVNFLKVHPKICGT
jgi:capsular polysaccharide biosynthesis protein